MTDSVSSEQPRICSDLKAGRYTYLEVVLFLKKKMTLLEQHQLGKVLESGLVASVQAAPRAV